MERNAYGLYDAPVPGLEPARLVLSQDDLDRQVKDGAFIMDREEAVKSGFINPYDDDTASLSPGSLP